MSSYLASLLRPGAMHMNDSICTAQGRSSLAGGGGHPGHLAAMAAWTAANSSSDLAATFGSRRLRVGQRSLALTLGNQAVLVSGRKYSPHKAHPTAHLRVIVAHMSERV